MMWRRNFDLSAREGGKCRQSGGRGGSTSFRHTPREGDGRVEKGHNSQGNDG